MPTVSILVGVLVVMGSFALFEKLPKERQALPKTQYSINF
jgi:hypothetical protein